ncbi:nitroreductase family protein [Bacillus cereus]|uniref:nitroreductase family protein n=1 Tax=Bacillus TaxID=1386 RepID=UPI00117F011D|nr:nitroreductase family protein [Bacillus sp. BD59S]MDA1951886.1 nitroreductase family protein [Bacillus cereus]QDQ04717.1 nitroreductase family protein [Bacillus sp. BD59S]
MPKNTVEEIMKARKSVKKYEKGIKIPQDQIEDILKLATTAPSAWNLQHWRYIVISSEDGKNRLLPIAYNQNQVVDSSVTIVILGDLEANKSAYEIYNQAVKEGHMNQQVCETLIDQIESAYKHNKSFARDEAILNSSLFAMQIMLSAKSKGYDTCAMGGFNKAALIKELNISSRFVPVMLLTIGKAAEPAYPSSRISLDRLALREEF